ncbi:MAG: YihY/virulence factor BrkB family protein [Acidobacteriota bacterium]|nr:YihY/virulence factor BrkB family protein [Acidobacteriota bacterium]
MSDEAKRITRLDREAEEERAEVASDLAAVRARVEIWKRRGGIWLQIAAVAAAAAGAGLAVSAAVRRIRRNRVESAASRWGRSFRKADSKLHKFKPRPIPITLLFALLRSPLARRALASGGEKLLARARRAAEEPRPEEEEPTEGRADVRAVEPDAEETPGKTLRAAGTKSGTGREKKAPPVSEEVGEKKAKQTLKALKHASWGERFKFVWELFRDAFKDFQKHEALTRGAALAYSTMLSLAPLLIIVVAVAGLAFGKADVRGRLLAQIGQLVGPQAAATVGSLMQQASKPSTGIFATILGVATLLVGAGGVFGYLQQMLNKIWDVPEKQTSGIWNMIQSRFLSLAMVLGTGFLLLVSLVISAALSAVGKKAGEEVTFLFGALHAIFSWAVVALLFALIFKFLPDTKIAWRDVWIGAAITSLLFVLGQFLIGLYLGRISGPYGGAGSLVVVLLWTYYSGLILFYGAEVTQVFANRYGSRK